MDDTEAIAACATGNKAGSTMSKVPLLIADVATQPVGGASVVLIGRVFFYWVNQLLGDCSCAREWRYSIRAPARKRHSNHQSSPHLTYTGWSPIQDGHSTNLVPWAYQAFEVRLGQ